MFRLIPALGLVLGLAACANGQSQLGEPLEPIGDFKLGHAAVVAPNLVEGPVSRNATEEEWIASVDEAVEERFRRYEGDSFYHMGISIEGFVLAQPGVPLVFSPKSALILRVTVWDDASQSNGAAISTLSVRGSRRAPQLLPPPARRASQPSAASLSPASSSNHQAQPCQPNCRARISGKPATARATVSPLAIERKDRNNAQNVRS